jgi:hypothetical protein
MQKTILLIALSVFSLGVFAQTKTEVKTDVQLENTDGKYHIIIKKEVDGKATTIDKTYNSLEELKNDPELEGINLHVLDGDKNEMVFFEEDGEEGDHKVNVIMELSEDSKLHTSDGTDHTYIFKSDGNEGEEIVHDIKVVVDEDGVKHIYKNGEEIEGNTWVNKDGKEYDIKKSDGKVMFFSEDGNTEFHTSGKGTSSFSFSTDGEEGEKHKNVIIIKSSEDNEDADGNKEVKVAVTVIEKLVIHLEEVEADEFDNFNGIDSKALKMDELNYYPNPNSGKFTLQFKADERPTEVRITGLDGKEVYSENLSGFNGTYQNEIDLSSQKRGVYLLQIIQGEKATNKKIVIE